ncbi:unnamed protein product [Toxocara canis]|uniref:LIM domain protein n=1 Tax=Toxocara canis TaxID=6265 RepID=A0A183UHH1_TOXCA|nr:unnamed protein product [Toxocara canis]
MMFLSMKVALTGNCSKCGESISSERAGCAALGRVYHVECFTCTQCGTQLAGTSFYTVDGRVLCEQDYRNAADRCECCGSPIMSKLLRAFGRTYHPTCFTCAACGRCLDGVPFTTDSSNQDQNESVRVVAMNKSFHINCYRCEDCSALLSSNIDGLGITMVSNELYLCFVLNMEVFLLSAFIVAQCCRRRRKLKDDDDMPVGPKERKPQTEVEKEAVKAIEQGKMREAHDNETVEDALSNWGAVQKIEGK